MYLILDLFRGFEIEYDRKNKILILNKPIPVSDFLYLKKLLKGISDEVKDIRVYSDRLTRVRSVLWVKKIWANTTT